MKKTIILIIAILSISVLSGCVDNKTVDTQKGNSTGTSIESNIKSNVEYNNGSSDNSDNVGPLNLTDEIDNSVGTGTSTGSNTGSDWCVPGSKIMVKLPSGEKEYTVAGPDVYKNRNVCRAERNIENGTSVYYYSKDGKYAAMFSNATGSGGAYSEAMSNVTSTY